MELIRELKAGRCEAPLVPVFQRVITSSILPKKRCWLGKPWMLRRSPWQHCRKSEQAIQRAKLRVREKQRPDMPVRENRDILLERSLNRLLDGEMESLESLNGFSAFAVVCLQTLTADPEAPLRESGRLSNWFAWKNRVVAFLRYARNGCWSLSPRHRTSP